MTRGGRQLSLRKTSISSSMLTAKSLLFLLLLAVSLQVAYSATVPDKFFGAWKVGRSEKFDEYLSARGVGWLTRKMIQLASLTKIFDKKSDGTYVMENRSSKGNIKWDGIRLEKQFEAKGLDGTMHKITFAFSNGQLTERHIRTYEGKQLDETYVYFVEGDELVMKLTSGDVVAKRWFTKITPPKE